MELLRRLNGSAINCLQKRSYYYHVGVIRKTSEAEHYIRINVKNTMFLPKYA